jgi:hypothetical protein
MFSRNQGNLVLDTFEFWQIDFSPNHKVQFIAIRSGGTADDGAGFGA